MATETFPFVSEMRAKGRAEGEAKAVLRILERRKVAVDDMSRQRIETCTDLKTLETWLDKSLTASTADELFKDWPAKLPLAQHPTTTSHVARLSPSVRRPGRRRSA